MLRRFSNRLKRFSCAVLCLCLPQCPSLAGPPSVSIEVAGIIEPRCSNTGSAYGIQVRDMATAGSDVIRFAVDCNAPFQYALTSQNGGFKLEGAAPHSSTLAFEVPYRVSVLIPLTGGGAIKDVCESSQIKAGVATCPFTGSGNSVAIGKTGELAVAWQASQRPLAAGTYQDRLTVSLGLRP